MAKIGWFGESYRHSLSSRGISTGSRRSYFQPKTRSAQSGGFAGFDFRGGFETGQDPASEEPASNIKLDGFPRRTRTKQPRADPGTGASSADVSGGATAGRRLQRLREERVLQRELEQAQLEKRDGQKAIARLKAGDYSLVAQALQSEDVSPAEKAAIRSQASAVAREMAAQGMTIPEDLARYVDPGVRAEIRAIQAQRAELTRGPLARTAREFGVAAVEGTEELAIRGVERLGDRASRTPAQILSEQALERDALLAAEERLYGPKVRNLGEVNPFFRGGVPNIFLGDNEAEAKLRVPPTYRRRVPAEQTEVFPLSEIILPDASKTAFESSPKDQESTYDMRVAKEVDALHRSKFSLGAVDTSPFDRARRAYRAGDREALIKALNDQEFEVQKQRSRWVLEEQTRSLVESQANREGALDDTGWNAFLSGGSKLVDQTQKIHDVRKAIKQGGDEAQQRSYIMRQMLKNLDARAPSPVGDPPRDIAVVAGARSPVMVSSLVSRPSTEVLRPLASRVKKFLPLGDETSSSKMALRRPGVVPRGWSVPVRESFRETKPVRELFVEAKRGGATVQSPSGV